MSSLKGPGDRIEARCTRCNDVTGHVIVALVGGVVVKVECCACGSVHKYYPPTAAKDKNAAESASAAPKRKATPGTKPKAAPRGQARAAQAAAATESAWRTAIERPSAPAAKTYSMTSALAIGDTVEHPVFGLGSVRTMVPPNKVEILFRDGMRLLRCAG
ncbi:MAG: hypothetical protein RRY29_07510 [Desulfovibrionaceae bacterium]